MPTSTFLPYFVRFLKENTAVRFFPPKYVFKIFDYYYLFFFFFFFFFFYNTGEWKFYITHIIYVMKTWSEFLNDNVKKRLRLHQRAPKTRVFSGPLAGPRPWPKGLRASRSWCALRAQKYFFSPQICFFKLNNTFFKWQVSSYAVRSLAFVIFYKILFWGSKYCFFPLRVLFLVFEGWHLWLWLQTSTLLHSCIVCKNK